MQTHTSSVQDECPEDILMMSFYHQIVQERKYITKVYLKIGDNLYEEDITITRLCIALSWLNAVAHTEGPCRQS